MNIDISGTFYTLYNDLREYKDKFFNYICHVYSTSDSQILTYNIQQFIIKHSYMVKIYITNIEIMKLTVSIVTAAAVRVSTLLRPLCY